MQGLRASRMGGFGIAGLHGARNGAWNPGLVDDPDVEALYEFEPLHPLKDTKGLNDLEFYNHVQPGFEHRAGAGAAHFGQSDEWKLILLNDDLAADFPLKTGSANTTVAVAFWYRYETGVGSAPIVAKWATNKRSFAIYTNTDAPPKIYMGIGKGTGVSSLSTPAVNRGLAANQWYFIVASYDSVTKDYFVYLYDETAGDEVTVSGTFTDPMVLTTAPWTCTGGGDAGWNDSGGMLDNLSVWNRTFDAAAAASLRTGGIDPETDADCKAFWPFEWGSMYEDIVGGNDFPTPTPTIETDKKQGKGSLRLHWTTQVIRENLARSDAALSAGFPLKSASGNDSYGVTCWVKAATIGNGAWAFPWTKGARFVNAGHFLRFEINSVNFYTWFDGGSPNLGHSDPVAGRWYFVGCGYNATTGKQKFYLWDDTAKSLLEDAESVDRRIVYGNLIYGAEPFRVGTFDMTSERGWNGWIDELAVFSRCPTSAEFAKICKGKY